METTTFPIGEACSSICALFWAVAVVLFRKSGEQVGPLALNVFKNAVALVLFLPSMIIAGISFFPADQTSADWVILILSGVVGIGISDTLFFVSLNRIGASRWAIVDCLYSPFVALCSVLYLGDVLSPCLLMGMFLMMGAILLAAWDPTSSNRTKASRQVLSGMAIGAASLLIAAVGIVAAKPVIDQSNPWWATTVRLVGGMAFLTIQSLLPRHRREVLGTFKPNRSWMLMVPAAFAGSYLAQVFWITGLKYTSTTAASVLNQLSIIFILVLAIVFLREKLTWPKSLAILLGFCGGILTTW